MWEDCSLKLDHLSFSEIERWAMFCGGKIACRCNDFFLLKPQFISHDDEMKKTQPSKKNVGQRCQSGKKDLETWKKWAKLQLHRECLYGMCFEQCAHVCVCLWGVCICSCVIFHPCRITVIWLLMIEECVWGERTLIGDMRGDSGGSVRE